jgi:hypothetical protein
METIKHLLGFCGEHWHPNLFTILATLIILKLVYEKNISKIIWRSRK